MKKFLIFFITICSAFLFAQSDYETTQNFKEKSKIISTSIKNIQTPEEIERAESAIKKLRADYEKHKDLLDKALYPENFEKVFENLNKTLNRKRKDIRKFTNLEDKIIDLRIQITDLNDKNMVLIGEIKELTKLRSKDSLEIAELNAKVRVLGKQIRERDNLVIAMVDSLLSDFVNQPEPLTDASKNNLNRKIESKNLFINVERTLQDNLDFLDLTVFAPEDLLELKKQNKEFRDVWEKLGPQLTNYYLNKADKKAEIQNINSLFDKWNNKIDSSVWASINYHFKNYDVKLLPFNNGNEFTANILAHITLELNSIEGKTEEELFKNFNNFKDSVWVKEVRPNWVPMLIENDYLTPDQRNTIEEKLVNWEHTIDDTDLTAIYVVFGILFLLFAAGVIKKYKK